MKFLPYRGFYPAERVTQIYELFHKNYLSEEVLARAQIRRDAPMTKAAISRYLDLRANASRFQAAKPFFGPGILMNSIKAGVAVDYPIFTGSFKCSWRSACNWIIKQFYKLIHSRDDYFYRVTN